MDSIENILSGILADVEEAATREPERPWRPSEEAIAWMLARFSERGYSASVAPAACRRLAAWAVANSKKRGRKGLIMYGSMGLGKTRFGERVLPYLCKDKWHGIFTATDACRLYNELSADEFERIVHGTYRGENHFEPAFEIMLDDLGREPVSVHYGQREDVMGNIICDRYRFWKNYGIKTYITCNISEVDIEKRYDARVIDRLREMCYPVHFTGESARGK
jgi:DNA replication protein DnaC